MTEDIFDHWYSIKDPRNSKIRFKYARKLANILFNQMPNASYRKICELELSSGQSTTARIIQIK